MMSNVLFCLVLLLAYNLHCECFTLQAGVNNVARFSQKQVENAAVSIQNKRSTLKMSENTDTVTEIQLGRVTMYKKEGERLELY